MLYSYVDNGLSWSPEKKAILPFAAWMHLEDIMLGEINHTEKQTLHDLTYLWNLKHLNS